MQTCADLYLSLADLLNTSRDEFERFESLAKDMLPGVDYKETQKRNRIRKKMPNEGNALEDKRSARDNFRISTFYEILDKLTTEMKRRGKIYTNIAHKFSCLTDVPNATQQGANYSQYSDRQRYLKTCQMLIDAYPEDLNNALSTELQQFHLYVLHKFETTKKTSFTHMELYKIIMDDKLESVFSNVEIALRIFLTLMVTNCSIERSFSQLKRVKSPDRSVMVQDRLDSLSLLMIQAKVLRKLTFEDIIRDFAKMKSRKMPFKS